MKPLWKCLRSTAAAALVAASLASCASNRPSGNQTDPANGTAAQPWGLTSGSGQLIPDPARHIPFSRLHGRHPTIATLHFDDASGVAAMKSLLPAPRKIPNRLPLTPDSFLEIQTSPVRAVKLEQCGSKVLCELKSNEQFALRLCNSGPHSLEFVITVDGLSVMDRSPGSVQQRGYVVESGKSYTVKGWRKNMKESAAFLTTTPAKDASAESLKNAGVLGIAVFTTANPETIRPKKATPITEMALAWVAAEPSAD